MGNVDDSGHGHAHADERGVLTGTTHSTGRDVTKKRPSPDTQPRFTSPSAQHDRKRARVEDRRKYSNGKKGGCTAVEYEVGLRDDDDTKHSRRYVRASSVVSPSKGPPIFPQRCKSVPLEGEDVVQSVDLTTVPLSPRRSPNRGDIEVKRAPSLPPVASDSMEVDGGELDSDDFSHLAIATPNQQKHPAFSYTVNFATPIANKRALFPLMTPLSPLTPLPPTPFTARPQKTCSVSQRTYSTPHSLEDDMDTGADTLISVPTSPTGATSTLDPSTVKPLTSCDPSPTANSRPSSVASSLTSELTSIEDVADLPSLSQELMPPPPVPSNPEEHEDIGSSTHLEQTNLPSAHSAATGPPMSKPTHRNSIFANGPAGPQQKRSTIAGAMKPKPRSSTSAVPRRVTRSLSVHKVSSDISQEDEVTSDGNENGQDGPRVRHAAAIVSIPSSPTTTAIAKHKAAARQGPPTSTSAFRPPPTGKLKQASLNAFMRPRSTGTTFTTPMTTSGLAHISNSAVVAAGPSKLAHPPSPSKIPLPVSPTKRTPGKAKERAFTISTSDRNIFATTSRGMALSTLSHALEKLDVPPPSRPNTSLGFTRLDTVGDDRGDGLSDVAQNGGESMASTEGAVKGKARANDDICLPSATSTSTATSGIKRAGFARPTASSLKRSVTLSGPAARTGAGGSSIFPGFRGRGVGGGSGTRQRGMTGIFGRAGERASKNPGLPTVAGSPVKGSKPNGEESGMPTGGKEGTMQRGDDGTAEIFELQPGGQGRAGSDLGMPTLDPPTDMTSANHQVFKSDTRPSVTSPSSSVDKGKQRTSPVSSSLALNPASSALHALSESLSSLPQTPPATKPRAIGTRQGLRSASAVINKTSPERGGPGYDPSSSNTLNANGAKDSGYGGGGMSESAGGINGSGGAKKSSLKVLKKCGIFVDVRTDQGDDAGSLFVDMLRGLGAKIMGRVCQSCTHIVYKNGLPNTLARYRLLNDPKPFVVGIAWVVECVEQRTRMDEEKYKVDVDLIDVAGGNTKRRRSMLPRYLIPLSPANVDTFANMSSEGDEEVETEDVNESPPRDADSSMRSKDEDDLPPLERARRRRSVLPGGQTRLFS
ncbi:hypothetical protein EDD15DRAFT_2296605 [Pisolithus albus]|nr:hypothetical protein EDD15DRAFT_2296605 [Pisolithus albus]